MLGTAEWLHTLWPLVLYSAPRSYLIPTFITRLIGECINKARGSGVLTAIATNLGSCSRRYDLELFRVDGLRFPPLMA
jgi:hypothetical protein